MTALREAWACPNPFEAGEPCEGCWKPQPAGTPAFYEPGPYYEPRDGTTYCGACVDRLEWQAAEVDAEIERMFTDWTARGCPTDDPNFGSKPA